MHPFDEDSLRAEIVRVWGEYGAHVEVFDMIRKAALAAQAPASPSLSDEQIDLAVEAYISTVGRAYVKSDIRAGIRAALATRSKP